MRFSTQENCRDAASENNKLQFPLTINASEIIPQGNKVLSVHLGIMSTNLENHVVTDTKDAVCVPHCEYYKVRFILKA